MQRAVTSIVFSTLPLATIGCLIPLTTQAQVTPDGTTSTTVNQDGNDFTINQGDRVGDNLFHSFNEFSVPTLGSAAFNNAGDIANIFSRVTGSSISTIDGLISANGAANLFLINPNGIIFGQNASLNLGGSFFASTADSLLFERNTEFSAVNPQAAPLLEVNIPIGAKFRDNPGNITVLSQSTPEAPFIPPAEAKLTFIGGNVSFDGATINASGRTLELGGLAEAGTVTLNDNLSLSFPNGVPKAGVFLNNDAYIDVISVGGGNININASNLELTQSFLFAGIRPNEGNPEAQAGDINIDATGEVNLGQGSSINNSVYIDGTGNSGNININTDSLNLTEGSVIGASTFGQGDAGGIDITANNTISAEGTDSEGFSSGVFSIVEETAEGDAGGIDITTGNLTLTDGGQVDASIFGQGNAGGIEITTGKLNLTQGSVINSSTQGKGNAGKILVDASNSISIDGVNSGGFVSTIANGVESGGVGNAGQIRIIAPNLSLTRGGMITSNTSGNGDAGGIFIDASGDILIDGTTPDGFVSGIFAGVFTDGVGNGGKIDIRAVNLSINNGALIEATTRGRGDGGSITINVNDNISIDGRSPDGFASGIFNRVETNGVGNGGKIKVASSDLSLTNNTSISTAIRGNGNAGEIDIVTNNLSIDKGSDINSNTFGRGDAGNINIIASDTISIDGIGEDGFVSNISSSVADSVAEGKGGKVNIETTNLSVINESLISVSTFGKGDSGNISITAEEILLDNGGKISGSVTNTALGNGGGIDITTGNLTLANGSVISASTFGQGNAGRIDITANNTISAEGTDSEGFSSGVFSTVDEIAVGDAGGIDITTGNLTLTDGGQIDASTFGQGDAGGINIAASDNISANETSQDGTSSGIFSTVGETAKGNAGGIDIATGKLTLTDGAEINSSTFGEGNGERVKITAFDTISIEGRDNERILTGIYSTVENTAIGNASGIEIDTVNLNLTNTGQISSSTFGKGNAGTIKITASDTIFVNGARDGTSSGVFSRVDKAAEGNSGGIEISTENLTLSNEAEINVGIFGKTNPEIESGNLDLTVQDLLIFKNSGKISAQATGNNNGGNVTINANDGLIIAFPNQNNDIFANAAQGNGGNINIFTQAIFGLEERRSTPPNQTNDIDASSEFGLQGDFSLNTPDFDPTTGLINLPASVGDASDQISQNPCQQGVGSEFIVTGKGGLPPTVSESLNSEAAQVGLIETVPSQQQKVEANAIPTENSTPEAVPAQGWVFNEKGEVTLTAHNHNPIKTGVQRSQPTPINSCSASLRETSNFKE